MDIAWASGEAGIERSSLRSADESPDLLLEATSATATRRGDRSTRSSTPRATTLMEGYVLLRRVAAGLAETRDPLERAVVGEFNHLARDGGALLTITALTTSSRAGSPAPALPSLASTPEDAA